MSKPVLHQSQISMWDRCPCQYYYRYVKGIIKPPGVAIVRGQGVHASSEKDLIAKRDTGQLLSQDEVTDIARDKVVDYWAETGVRLTDDEKGEDEKKVLADTIDAAVALAKTHHNELAPQLEPVHIERPWKLEINNFPVDLQGTIDLQEPTALRDLKTSGKSPVKTAAETSLQLTLYHLAATRLDKKSPETVALDYLVTTKVPKVVTLTSTRGAPHWEQLIRRVALIHEAIQAGIFVPTLPENWVCCDRWCGYWADECPFGRRNQHTTRGL